MQDRTKSLLALAAGTFGLGITEFAMMGILPIIADAFNISIPQAGMGYRYPALIGCCFVAGGIVCYTIICRLYEKKAIFEN